MRTLICGFVRLFNRRGNRSSKSRLGKQTDRSANSTLKSCNNSICRFASDPNLPPNLNVAKRTFKMNPDQIKLTLHYAENRITASSRTYEKDGAVTVSEVDPLAARLDSAQLAAENQRMLAAERTAMQVSDCKALRKKKGDRAKTFASENGMCDESHDGFGPLPCLPRARPSCDAANLLVLFNRKPFCFSVGLKAFHSRFGREGR